MHSCHSIYVIGNYIKLEINLTIEYSQSYYRHWKLLQIENNFFRNETKVMLNNLREEGYILDTWEGPTQGFLKDLRLQDRVQITNINFILLLKKRVQHIWNVFREWNCSPKLQHYITKTIQSFLSTPWASIYTSFLV